MKRLNKLLFALTLSACMILIPSCKKADDYNKTPKQERFPQMEEWYGGKPGPEKQDNKTQEGPFVEYQSLDALHSDSACEYIVKKGDTFSIIAEANNTYVEDLMKLNSQIKDKNLLQPGDKITLKDCYYK